MTPGPPSRTSGAPDEDFLALPVTALADAALHTALELGAVDADVRVHRTRRSVVGLHDAALVLATDDADLALSVRVVVDGVRGFAVTGDLTPEAAAGAARAAVELALVAAPLALERIDLAPAPVEPERTWSSSWEIDPFAVPRHEQIALLEGWSARLLSRAPVTHVDASVVMLKEQKFLADARGTSIWQQRILLHPEVTVVAVDRDAWRAEAMRTLAPPVARGWEYLRDEAGWDWAAELAALPELVRERLSAPTVRDGVYDLVVDPTNLWRTVHETLGHVTEIDRALGSEATLSGDTFASPLRLGDLVMGSELLQVSADRTAEHACGTVGYDDDGVAAGRWRLVEDGVLTGFQVDRATAAAAGEERSNGCAHAPSPLGPSLPRTANVNLDPVPEGPTLEDLIGAVDDGFYVVGDAGFATDRRSGWFRAGAQRFYRIVGGEVRGQVRDAVYESSTPGFWTALSAVGAPATFQYGGTSHCEKGDPPHAAWASHGAPATLFAGVPVVPGGPDAARGGA